MPFASFTDLWERTAVGPVPGQIVQMVGAVFYLSLFVIGVVTFRPQNRSETLMQRPLKIAFAYWPVPSNTERFPSLDR